MNAFVRMVINLKKQMKKILNQLNSKHLIFCLISSVLVLTGCGGGGGGDAPNVQPVAVVSTNTFNFQSAWQKFYTTQYSKTLNVSGSCSGSLTYAHTAMGKPTAYDIADLTLPHPVVNVNPSYVVTNLVEVKATLQGCSTTSSSTATTSFYDPTTFAPYGYIGGTAYNGATSWKNTFREFSSRVVLPSSIKVGDIGVVGTVFTYETSNFKKNGSPQGRTDVTYVVEADTATTALVNITSKVYDVNGKLTLVDQTRYQIDANNNLTLISIDQQYSDTLTLHLIAK